MNRFIYILFICLLSVALCSRAKPAGAQESDTSDFCISQEAVNLYKLINEYRRVLRLPAIPLSNSLCRVAETHGNDLNAHYIHNEECNYHSWSDQGSWSPCCYHSKLKDKRCMTEKPSELTSYPGKGYEVIYWDSRGASPSKAFDQWKTVHAAKSMLINLREWEEVVWKAMGISIKGNFAILWLGEAEDPVNGTLICGTNDTIVNKKANPAAEGAILTKPTDRFHIIVRSFNAEADAQTALKELREDGNDEARLIANDNKYRISLMSFADRESAEEAKSRLENKYKDAWIMEF